MKLTVLCTSPAVGGAERQAIHLVDQVRHHTDWSCRFVALVRGGAGAVAGGDVVDASLWAAASACIRADVIVAFNYHPMIFARLLPGSTRIISSVRTPNLGSRGRHVIASMTKWRDAATVFNSASVANDACRRREVRGSSACVIPNIVATQEEAPARAPRVGTGTTFTWIFVGRNHEAKGVDELRAVLRRLDGGPGRRRLIVLGRGHELWTAQDAAAVATEIEYRGEVADVRTHLVDADALLMTSRWEGSPNAVLEAMAEGLPCLATNVGGIRDIPKGSGLVAVEPSVEALAAGVQRMERLPAIELERMGRSGASYIEAHHSAKVVWPLWREVISRSR